MNLTDDDKKWLENLIERVEARLEAKLERYASKKDLERVETNLLTEFHKWASPAEARLRLQKDNLHTIELEMELLSHRIKKLEGPRPS